jgi:hypothetical protein
MKTTRHLPVLIRQIIITLAMASTVLLAPPSKPPHRHHRQRSGPIRSRDRHRLDGTLKFAH